MDAGSQSVSDLWKPSETLSLIQSSLVASSVDRRNKYALLRLFFSCFYLFCDSLLSVVVSQPLISVGITGKLKN